MILSDMLELLRRKIAVVLPFFFIRFFFVSFSLSSCQYTHRPDDPIVFYGVVCVFFFARCLGGQGQGQPRG
jgi:hypothetical protein